jgi:hypothetical protein
MFCSALAISTLAGCYNVRPSAGGGQIEAAPVRRTNPDDIALPSGYRIEAVASGFTFPTGVAFDDEGTPHVIEAGYSYGEVFTVPRLARVNRDGTLTELLVDATRAYAYCGGRVLVSIDNVLNREYEQFVGFPGRGRRARVGLSFDI